MSKTITVPYFLTVGNHDSHPKVPFSEKIYKEQVDLPGNELYYSFIAGNSLFVVLDSYIDDQEKRITGEQLKWLEGVLAGSDKKHKFVFRPPSALYRDEQGEASRQQPGPLQG